MALRDAGLIERVVGALGLTEKQRKELGPAIRREMNSVLSDAEEVAA